MTILTKAAKIPLMYQAQINGRCQIQRLIPKAEEQDAIRWADEWIDKTYPKAPDFGDQVQTRTYQLSWRFVTNGGQDDGVIRPVLGARGWPYYPGSSMKGIFRRACTPEQADRYCGRNLGREGMTPGILRFLGGYPTDTRWTEQLVDIVHPQQDWQVKEDRKAAGAFVQISLYKPQMQFGLSSAEDLSEEEWTRIWGIWERAIATGIGCRVCAGYGQPLQQQRSSQTLYAVRLRGQGQAAKLIDGTGEFRPNIFRAAIRGHALRIFGGLTEAKTSETLVNELFGTVQGGGKTGLLNMAFLESDLVLGSFGQGSYTQPTYDVEGELVWSMTTSLSEAKIQALRNLVGYLTQFAVILGGFGKSWRRADHRLFYPEYAELSDKPLIGCHWEWVGDRSLRSDVRVRKPEQLGDFIDTVRKMAQAWMAVQGITPKPDQRADWREAWHPKTVEVWGRMADQAEDSRAIRWFHGPYQEAIPRAKLKEGSIYRSSLTGQMSQIGRIWHRMYPHVGLLKRRDDPTGKRILRQTSKFMEFLTIFPDTAQGTEEFLGFLDTQERLEKGFKRLWPRD